MKIEVEVYEYGVITLEPTGDNLMMISLHDDPDQDDHEVAFTRDELGEFIQALTIQHQALMTTYYNSTLVGGLT